MLAALIANSNEPPPAVTFAPVKEPIIVGITVAGSGGGTVGNGPGGGN